MNPARGVARSGRHWWACIRPDCDAYESGHPNLAIALARWRKHEEGHR